MKTIWNALVLSLVAPLCNASVHIFPFEGSGEDYGLPEGSKVLVYIDVMNEDPDMGHNDGMLEAIAIEGGRRIVSLTCRMLNAEGRGVITSRFTFQFAEDTEYKLIPNFYSLEGKTKQYCAPGIVPK